MLPGIPPPDSSKERVLNQVVGSCLIPPLEFSKVESFKSSDGEDRLEGSTKAAFEKEGCLGGSHDSIWQTVSEKLPDVFIYNVEQNLDTFNSNAHRKS